MPVWVGCDRLKDEDDLEDKDKTKERLVSELAEMRQRVTDMQGRLWRLEAAESERKWSEEMYRALVDCSFIDVTEEMRAGNVSREKETHEALVLRSLPMAFYIAQPWGDFGGTWVSEQIDRVSGFTVQQFLADPHLWAARLHPEDQARVLAAFEGLLDKDALKIEYRWQAADGRYLWFLDQAVLVRDESGEPKEVVGTWLDITERKQAEAEQERLLAQIQEQAQRVQQILDTVPEGVLLLDGSRQVVQANPLGKRVLDVLASAKVGDTLSHLGDLSLARLLTLSPEGLWHETTADGRNFQVVARSIETSHPPLEACLRSESGGWVVVIRDVTREREIQRRVQQQDRLAVIGQLAGAVAHDFNNVLTAIQGFTELVLDQLEQNDPFRADLEQVTRAANRAAMLICQLLAFSRKQVLQPVVMDLDGVISDMEKMLRRLIGENITLHTALSPDLGQVMADPGQIEQVIMNLAVNARDAMLRGGTLLLETKNVVLDETYAHMHPGVQPGAHVVLAVSDTGVGMTEEVRAHIFEPFFTTKDKNQGTGLGLSTVHGIVTQSGGHIEVYSEPGVGTTFKVYLPRVDAKVEAQKASIDANWQGTETVLLAEDDNVVRALARRSLERYGYTVLEARQADEAVLVCKQYEGQIDLVVTDVIMPGGMSGRDLAEHLVSLRPGIKVLYTSGYTDEAIAYHGVLERGAAFLQKPFTPDSLAQKVREVLDACLGTGRP
jgi:two-component system cell cycle sensor histidine kinase/response regulator CckA